MKYFQKREFECKCGCGTGDMSEELLARLDKARKAAGVPFIVTSGYRCEKYNKELKERGYNASKESAHMKGMAADIAVNDTNKDRILMALSRYFDRIGIGANFIHVDVDSSKPRAMWYY